MILRILVVAHDRALRATRVTLLESAGYMVTSVETDNDAMTLLETAAFDLILLGRKSVIPKKGIDQRLRERYPDLPILKIEDKDVEASIYPSRIIGSRPEHVLAAIREMVGDDLPLVAVEPRVGTGFPEG